MEDDFAKGLALNPDYTPIYSAKAEYLLPRWNGEPGDWESCVTPAADRMRRGRRRHPLHVHRALGRLHRGGLAFSRTRSCPTRG